MNINLTGAAVVTFEPGILVEEAAVDEVGIVHLTIHRVERFDARPRPMIIEDGEGNRWALLAGTHGSQVRPWLWAGMAGRIEAAARVRAATGCLTGSGGSRAADRHAFRNAGAGGGESLKEARQSLRSCSPAAAAPPCSRHLTLCRSGTVSIRSLCRWRLG
jgi:hypothetical protein